MVTYLAVQNIIQQITFCSQLLFLSFGEDGQEETEQAQPNLSASSRGSNYEDSAQHSKNTRKPISKHVEVQQAQ